MCAHEHFCAHFSIDTSKPKSFVLSSCCELDSENTLSQCRITGALEGTQFRLVAKQLSLQLPTTIAEGGADSYMCTPKAINLPGFF